MTIASPCNVVIGDFKNSRIVRLSKESPQTLFIDVSGSGLMGRNGVLVKCENKAVRIVTACLCRPGVLLEKGKIIDMLFGDRADGGPDRVDLVIGRAVGAARIAGAALGIVVTTEWGRGVYARLTDEAQRG